jgi:hypothetical protein
MIEACQEPVSACLLRACCRFIVARMPRHCLFLMPYNMRWFSELRSDYPLNFISLQASYRNVLRHSDSAGISQVGISVFYSSCAESKHHRRNLAEVVVSLARHPVIASQSLGRSCCIGSPHGRLLVQLVLWRSNGFASGNCPLLEMLLVTLLLLILVAGWCSLIQARPLQWAMECPSKRLRIGDYKCNSLAIGFACAARRELSPLR